MSDFFNEDQLFVLEQSLRGKQIKIEVLDFNFKTLDTIEGECQGGDINEDATSDNRRSLSISLIVSSQYTNIVTNKYNIQKDALIWLNKYIKVYIGITNLQNDEVVWYNRGLFLIDSPSYSYSTIENTLSFNGIDIMAKYMNERTGQLCNLYTTIEAYTDVSLLYVYNTTENKNKVVVSSSTVTLNINNNDYVGATLTIVNGSYIKFIWPSSTVNSAINNISIVNNGTTSSYTTNIPASVLRSSSTCVLQYSTSTSRFEYMGTNSDLTINLTLIRNAIKSVIEDFTDIQQYYIAPIPETLKYLPEDIKYEAGSTVYDILRKLMEYLPNWEIFFDEDGIFNIQPIPSGSDDTIYPVDNQFTQQEENNVDFGNVKNHIVVAGKTHDSLYYVYNDSTNTNRVSYTTSGADNILVLSIDNYDLVKVRNNTLIKFNSIDSLYNVTLNKLRINYLVNGTSVSITYTLTDFEKQNLFIPIYTIQPGSIITLRYNCAGAINNQSPYWDFLSDEQVWYVAINNNKDSQFYINADIVGENYYGGLTESTNGISYSCVLNNTNALSNLNLNTQITIMPNVENGVNSTLSIIDIYGTSLGTLPIGNVSNNVFTALPAGKWLYDGTIYTLQYKTYISGGNTVAYLEFIGRLQTYTLYCSGGEYENIYSNQLAKERANYELYLHSNLNDSITITTVPIYYMKVNKRIVFTSKSDGKSHFYLTKTITIPLDSTGENMVINAIRIYE